MFALKGQVCSSQVAHRRITKIKHI